MSKLRNSLFALTGLALVAAAALLGGTPAGADNGPNHRVRNLNFGVSGGNVNDASRSFCCSGTLGSLITDGTNQYILSNNHVVGLAGRARVGDDVSQPGLIDNGCRIADVVADFTAAPALSANVDAAIAQLRPGMMNPLGAIEDIGTISSTVRNASVGLPVQKSGRTTGHTTGAVSSINTTVSIRYPKSCGSGGGTAFTFRNQVVVTPGTFSAGGDSGSLILTNDSNKQPVALLFAGSSSSTIGNPIGEVLTRVGSSLGRPVSFVGAGGGAQAASLGYTISSEGVFMQQLPEAAADVARAALARNESALMGRADVLGVGIGQASQDPTEAVIVIYVNQNARAAGRDLPKAIDGIRVRRVFTDEFVAR
ncbi:MAG TPA: hypothetical protein VIP46_14625 [Pyrinomonadaceae bacterium]